jgi:hypothetical protein
MDSISFWNFIRKYQIEIPIIQRDYAQGRQGKEKLRKVFLLNLKQALDGTLPHGERVLKLDFVYGATEKGKMLPLDGQQRLTTLWLLHWYLALRTGNLKTASETLLHFTYKTRISSRDFCEKLCDSALFIRYDDASSVTDYITKQTWFYSAWTQDPTVKSMLTMLSGTKLTDKRENDILDGIEELFKDSSKEEYQRYWNSLTSEDAPIVFYHLDLEDFGLSDDLYIKMNARGKQLTAFENFKADLIGYIKDKAADTKELEEADAVEWEALLNVKDGLPLKMDTIWTDIFWRNKSVGISTEDGSVAMSNQIDGIFLAFINRFFWDALFTEKDSSGKHLLPLGEGRLPDGTKTYTIENSNSSYNYLNADKYDSYSDLEPYKFSVDKDIPLSFFKKLVKVLDRIAAYQEAIPSCLWDTEFRFIPEYTLGDDGYNIEKYNAFKESYLECTTLTQTQRIVFHAIVKYLTEGDAEKNSFKQWMRVIWNLISGEGDDGRPQIRSTLATRNAINFIDRLDSHKVYESLNELKGVDLGTSDFDKRCKEEVIKATKIIDTRNDNYSWETIFVQAENTAFFKGAIRFLYMDEYGNPEWSQFDTKFKNAKIYFSPGRIENYTDLRYFISRCDSEMQVQSIIYDIRPCSWMSNLLNENLFLPVSEFLITTPENNPLCLHIKEKISNSRYANAINDIVNSELLANMSYWGAHVDACHFREDLYGLFALLPNNAKSEMKKFVVGHYRNALLAHLVNDKQISSSQKLPGCDYFWGWNIDFKYADISFRWCYDDKIYVIDAQNRLITIGDNTEGEDPKYLCFPMDEQKDALFFFHELDQLITKLPVINKE